MIDQEQRAGGSVCLARWLCVALGFAPRASGVSGAGMRREPRLCTRILQSSLPCPVTAVSFTASARKGTLTGPQSGAGSWDSHSSPWSPAQMTLAVLTPSTVTRNQEGQVSRWTVLFIGSLDCSFFTLGLCEFVLDFYLIFIPL